MRGVAFTPRPAGLRFYHTQNRAGATHNTQVRTGGQVGPAYIDPRHEPGSYDKEVFFVLKGFEPSFRQGCDTFQDVVARSAGRRAWKRPASRGWRLPSPKACRAAMKWA